MRFDYYMVGQILDKGKKSDPKLISYNHNYKGKEIWDKILP